MIPNFSEPLEDTVIVALRDEKELSILLCNTFQELPVTLEDFKKTAEKDEFILKNEETGMAI